MQISVWEKESFYAKRDIIIIGAGLAGLWCAYELINNNPNLKILMLEKGIIPEGASTRNAGFACIGSPTELLHDAAKMGEDKMLSITEMRFKGIEKIRKVLGDKIIDFDNCGGFECLTNELNDIKKIKEDVFELNKKLKQITSLDETFVWANDKMKTVGLAGFDAMIENSLEGGLHSGKLMHALTKKVQNLGVDILTNIEIKSWEEKNDGIKIETEASENIIFYCSQLFICTNAFTGRLFPALNITPARGQVLVTNEIENLQLRGTFHYDEGFYYFRNIGKRVLLGGARNKAFDEEATTELTTTNKVQQALENFLATHILSSQKFKIEHRWSGIMGFTNDKEPIVKNISKKVIAIIACNGMGVALTPVIAEKIKYYSE
jgi:glycine/D-amino acid oxidase-like deaminating enzyme